MDAASYFEKRFPDVEPMDSNGANANCAEWLLSVTTQVRMHATLSCVRQDYKLQTPSCDCKNSNPFFGL